MYFSARLLQIAFKVSDLLLISALVLLVAVDELLIGSEQSRIIQKPSCLVLEVGDLRLRVQGWWLIQLCCVRQQVQ